MSSPDTIQTANRLRSRALVFERAGAALPELAELPPDMREEVAALLPDALRAKAEMLEAGRG